MTGDVADKEMIEDDTSKAMDMEGGSGRSAAARNRVRHGLLAHSFPVSVGESSFPGSGSSKLSP